MDFNKFPKVLITCPVSARHSKLFNKWLSNLDKLTYPFFDVLVIDNTLDKGKYFEKLKKKSLKPFKFRGEICNRRLIVLRHEWDKKTLHPLQMLAHVREESRKYFLESDREYTHLFHLDDDVFIKKDSIQRLLGYNKDLVGFYVPVFYKPKRIPCALKSGEIIMGKGLDYYSFKEINAYKRFIKKFKENKLTKEEKNFIPFIIKDRLHPELFPTYAVGLGGGLMCSRKVMESTKFNTHPTFIYGEDLWWYTDVEAKGFVMWLDTGRRPIHKNVEWDSVISKCKKQMQGFFILHGPENAKGVEIIDRSLKTKENK